MPLLTSLYEILSSHYLFTLLCVVQCQDDQVIKPATHLLKALELFGYFLPSSITIRTQSIFFFKTYSSPFFLHILHMFSPLKPSFLPSSVKTWILYLFSPLKPILLPSSKLQLRYYPLCSALEPSRVPYLQLSQKLNHFVLFPEPNCYFPNQFHLHVLCPCLNVFTNLNTILSLCHVKMATKLYNSNENFQTSREISNLSRPERPNLKFPTCSQIPNPIRTQRIILNTEAHMLNFLLEEVKGFVAFLRNQYSIIIWTQAYLKMTLL